MNNKLELCFLVFISWVILFVLSSCAGRFTKKEIGVIKYEDITCVQILLPTSSDSYKVIDIIPNKKVKDILK